MIRRLVGKMISIWRRIPSDRVYIVLLMLIGSVFLMGSGGFHYYTDPFCRGVVLVCERAGIELPEGLAKLGEKPEVADGGYAGSSGKTELPEGSGGKESAGNRVPERSEYADQLPEVPEGSGGTGIPDERAPEGKDEYADQLPEVPEGSGGTGIPDGSTPDTVVDAEPVLGYVGEDYFNDAVFIGDSRTVGLSEYSSLKDSSTFYAATGLSVHKLFTAKIVSVPGQKSKITVEKALSERQFSKVYLMLGINEMGTGTAESFVQKYGECVERIRELQPDATIYLQSIMKVTGKRSQKGDYINNEGIEARNEGIKALADNRTVFYLDVNEAVCDEDGALREEYTHDGVHLKAQYIDLWKEYLMSHAVIME